MTEASASKFLCGRSRGLAAKKWGSMAGGEQSGWRPKGAVSIFCVGTMHGGHTRARLFAWAIRP
jgi:hypothetical protein